MLTAITKGLAAKRDRLEKDDKGFTLIELLVVILIIGILAAIAIPVFLGQQNSAKDAAAKSDITNAKIALIAYATDHDGAYLTPGGAQLTGSELANYGYTQSSGTGSSVSIFANAAGKFCISEKSGTDSFFKILDSGSVTTATGQCASVTG